MLFNFFKNSPSLQQNEKISFPTPAFMMKLHDDFFELFIRVGQSQLISKHEGRIDDLLSQGSNSKIFDSNLGF
jgi:hypothetical protein